MPARRKASNFRRHKEKGNPWQQGECWQGVSPQGDRLLVDTHGVPDKELGQAIPYGVYDIHRNKAWTSVGVSHDTAEFAVEAILSWWKRLGKKCYGPSVR